MSPARGPPSLLATPSRASEEKPHTIPPAQSDPPWGCSSPPPPRSFAPPPRSRPPPPSLLPRRTRLARSSWGTRTHSSEPPRTALSLARTASGLGGAGGANTGLGRLWDLVMGVGVWELDTSYTRSGTRRTRVCVLPDCLLLVCQPLAGMPTGSQPTAPPTSRSSATTASSHGSKSVGRSVRARVPHFAVRMCMHASQHPPLINRGRRAQRLRY